MVCVRFSVATSTSTSRLHNHTFQCSLRGAGLLRCPGLVAVKDHLGTSCGQLEEGGADLWSCLVGGTALGPRPSAGQERLACCGEQRPSHRSTKHDQAPLLCGVAHGCLARSVRLGSCGLGASWASRAKDNTLEIFTFNGYRCWPSSASRHPVRGERVRHTIRGARCSFSSETGDNQIALAFLREYPLSLGAKVHF